MFRLVHWAAAERRFDFAEMALFDWQWRQRFGAYPSAAMSADLHSQRTAIDSQDHHWGSLLHGGALTPAVGVILAQSLAVAGRCLSQSLCHSPHTHSADGNSQEQMRQPCRQFVWRHYSQQSQPPSQGTTNAAWLLTKKIQQGLLFLITTRTTVPCRGGVQSPPVR